MQKNYKVRIFIMNIQKTTLILFIFAIIIGSYINFHRLNTVSIPKLKFEYICPDSYGNKPVFKFEDFNIKRTTA